MWEGWQAAWNTDAVVRVLINEMNDAPNLTFDKLEPGLRQGLSVGGYLGKELIEMILGIVKENVQRLAKIQMNEALSTEPAAEQHADDHAIYQCGKRFDNREYGVYRHDVVKEVPLTEADKQEAVNLLITGYRLGSRYENIAPGMQSALRDRLEVFELRRK
jgi:hypothetical protein